ncbi:helix-turn-helix domain-containing protein [Rhodocytophaga rosea]|uniref:Helix-turn-helix domain-containing protein n=1 Tax=Rhodocytophaga rosea TaxID=2704465 RepID=A0A6C0GKQ5_9BACT|nr:helix-turn-helix domain-containing protein [Rhodocytophaga rosea]QHT67315.1 helix-turn-helix domain-containing protein [Rhodocytophaga rosea]QHT68394.1 helix-turn-helix domain-containing protein [Rhodocytophaga rosea]QHT69550.1 helix-turn-helix domain-containing protein [Rhodocytophaga rosea]
MRYIKEITDKQKQDLEKIHKDSKSYQERNRCQCILLSNQGYQVQKLASIFQVSQLSIYKWFDRFEKTGVVGLKNQKGKGRKPILTTSNATHVEVVENSIEKEKQQLKLAKREIEAKLGTAMSEMTLKRFLKKLTTDGNVSVNG